MMLAGMNGNNMSRLIGKCTVVLVSLLIFFAAPLAYAEDAAQQSNGAQVLQAFDQQQTERVNSDKLTDHRKHVIIFLLGAPLLVMLLITGGLGVAVGVYGRQQLFAAHMVFAGLSITLAIVHAVVSVIWFFPF